MKKMLLSLIMALIVISMMPITMAAYETNTDDDGFYTLSNLPAGTYTITATAFGPPKEIADQFGIKQVEAMGEITVTLKEGEHLKGKDIMVEMNKKLNTIPVDPGEGTGSISGKVLFDHPYLKMVIPAPSKSCDTKVVINQI